MILGSTGDYFRPLVPGYYQIAVEASGYLPQVKYVNVTQNSIVKRKAIVVNFQLQRDENEAVLEPETRFEVPPTKVYDETFLDEQAKNNVLDYANLPLENMLGY